MHPFTENYSVVKNSSVMKNKQSNLFVMLCYASVGNLPTLIGWGEIVKSENVKHGSNYCD